MPVHDMQENAYKYQDTCHQDNDFVDQQWGPA